MRTSILPEYVYITYQPVLAVTTMQAKDGKLMHLVSFGILH